MADTGQIASWSLERPCPLRTGADWFLPVSTRQQLGRLRSVASSLSNGREFEEIIITGYSVPDFDDVLDGVWDHSPKSTWVPVSGFRAGSAIRPYTDVEQIVEICRNCEANCASSQPLKIVGCFGWVDTPVSWERVEPLLQRVLRDRNLSERLDRLFVRTKPLWWGFWIDSPLNRPQAELLLELFETAFSDVASEQMNDEGMSGFLAALKASIDWQIPLHVAMSPPGHTDLGYITTFAHCPRCKAEARLKRWTGSYPKTPYKCHVCSHVYIPRDTAASKPDDGLNSKPGGDDSEPSDLRELLGDDYDDFAIRFLIHRGCTVEQATMIIDKHNEGPVLRRIASVRNKRRQTLKQLHEARRPRAPGLDDLPLTLSLHLTLKHRLDFVLIPAGEFLMGSPSGAKSRSDEHPQHLVRIAYPFYVGRTAVTQAQWQAVMGGNPSAHRDDPNLPVESINWFAAQEFCERLCQKLRRPIRLPSEAEWEYACRAGTTTEFAFGDELVPDQATFTPDITVVQHFEGDFRKTTLVGSYPPNAWGLYDMHGNTDEWCEDTWHNDYAGAPGDGSAWIENSDTPSIVVRGGWCGGPALHCRSARRESRRADAGSEGFETSEASSNATDGLGDEEVLAHLNGTVFRPGSLSMPTGLRVVCEIR